MNFCWVFFSLFMTINIFRFWTVEQNGQINLTLDIFAKTNRLEMKNDNSVKR